MKQFTTVASTFIDNFSVEFHPEATCVSIDNEQKNSKFVHAINSSFLILEDYIRRLCQGTDANPNLQKPNIIQDSQTLLERLSVIQIILGSHHMNDKVSYMVHDLSRRLQLLSAPVGVIFRSEKFICFLGFLGHELTDRSVLISWANCK